MGFLSLNCPLFQFSTDFDFFVDLRVIFLADFLCIEGISVLYNRDSNFTNV